MRQTMIAQSLVTSLISIIPGVRRSLSTQLLMLTILVVLITEIIIMIPSVAHQHTSWLRMRTEATYLVGLALNDLQETAVNDGMVEKILMSANITGVTLQTGNAQTVILASGVTVLDYDDIHDIDLDQYNRFDMIIDAWKTIAGGGAKLIRVVDHTTLQNSRIQDLILSRSQLRQSLRSYALNILALSLLISCITALFVYWSLNNLIIKPVRNMRENMLQFEADPENPDTVLLPSTRMDEIGDAERDLNMLEQRLQTLLNERRRLAALGAGISKISHDLRNILASAQLMSDRLVKSDDPRVKKLSPRLVDALDRAIILSRETLNYGRISPEILNRETIKLHDLINDIFDDTASMHVTMTNQVPEETIVKIDRTQFHRGVTNIIRNSVEALLPDGVENTDADSFEPGQTTDKTINVTAENHGGSTIIEISDNGPGLPDTAKEFLYEPFKGSYKPGGSGLGIAITAEVVRAHGGQLNLIKSDNSGATFRITIPQNTKTEVLPPKPNHNKPQI